MKIMNNNGSSFGVIDVNERVELRRNLMLIGIFSLFLIAIAAIASVSPFQEDNYIVNPTTNTYTDADRYDSIVKNINGVVMPAPVVQDISEFKYPASSNTSLHVLVNDPNANLKAETIAGAIRIFDNSDNKNLYNFSILYSDIAPYVIDGKVGMSHTNITGKIDALWVQNVVNHNGYAYFENMPFSGLSIFPYGVDDFVVTTKASNIAYIVSSAGALSHSPTVGTEAWGCAVNQAGTRAYVTNNASDTVSVIDIAAGTVVTTVTVGDKPSGVAVTPDGSKVYVANYGGNTVSVIRTSDNTVIATISGFTLPLGVTAAPAGDYIYVSNCGVTTTVLKISTSSDTVVATFPATSFGGSSGLLRGMAVSPNGATLYVAAYNRGTIYSVATSDGSPTGVNYASATSANCVALSPDGTKLASSNRGGATVCTWNVGTAARVASITPGASCGTEGIEFDVTGTYVYVVAYSTHILYRITFASSSSATYWTDAVANSPYSWGNSFFQNKQIAQVGVFTRSPTSGTYPTNVQFTDASTGATSWYWDFGDGQTSTSQSPSHQYATGTFTVTETAYNTVGYEVYEFTNCVSVSKATPTISWSNPAAITYGSNMASLSTSPSSGGVAGSYSYSPALSSVPNAGSPTVTATFTPTDTTNYNSGSTGSCTVTVNKATPTISWGDQAAITYGQGCTVNNPAPTSGGVAGSYTYNPAAGTVLGAGWQSLQATFTPTDTANYNSGSNGWCHQTVNKATPTVTWSNPAAINQGTALSGTQLNAGNSYGAAGTYTYSPVSGTVLGIGASQTLGVTWAPTDTANYNGNTGTAYITVNAVTPTAALSGTPTSGTVPRTVQFTDTTTYTGSNLMPNGGFENLYPAGYASNTLTYALTTAQKHAGSYSISTINTATGDPCIDFYGPVNLVASTQYVVSSWAFCTSDTYVRPPVFYSGTSPYQAVGDGWNQPVVFIPANTWTRVQYYGNSGSGSWVAAHTLRLRGSCNSGGVYDTTKTIYWDDVTIAPASWSWNFGDGWTSTVESPSHTYYQPGTYTVSLQTTTNGNANTATSTNYITTTQPTPTAAYSGTPTTGNSPDTVTFTDSSTVNSIIDNGDIEAALPSSVWGATTSVTRSSDYAHAGSYSMKVVSTSAGSDCYVQINNDILNLLPNTQYYWEAYVYSPVGSSMDTGNTFMQEDGNDWAGIAFGYINGVRSYQALPAGVWTKIYGYGTTDSNWYGTSHSRLIVRPAGQYGSYDTVNALYYDDFKVYPITWAWDFGDGSTSTAFNPSHTYYAPGTYTVTLTTTTATVNDGETKANYITTNQPTPTAAFSGTPTSGNNPVTVQFTDSSTVNNMINNPSMEAALPIGTTSNLVTYAQSSTYAHTGTKSMSVQSQTAPFTNYPYMLVGANNFVLNPSTQYYWEIWVYSPTATQIYPGNMGIWEWCGGYRGYPTGEIAGNGNLQTLPANTWTKMSGITTTPADMDAGGLKYQNIFVLRPPQSDANTYDTSKTIYYDDFVMYPVTYDWNWGDGTTHGTTKNPSHQYTTPGTYTVTETITTYNTNDAEAKSNYITDINPTPDAAFTSNISSGTYPVTVAFTDTSTNTPTSWAWNFDDGSANVTTQNPTHLFVGSGTFHVTMTATNAGGTDSIQHTITVNKATPSLTWSPSPTSFTYGTGLTSGQLNAASGGVAGTFAYTFGGNPVVVGSLIQVGSDQLTATFTPTDTANYNSGGTTQQTFTVSKATPSLSYSPSPSTITYGTTLVSGQFNAASGGVAGSFGYTFGGNPIVAGQLIAAGSDSVTATFTATDTTNYTSGGTTAATITVNKATPSLSWSPSPTSFTYGTGLTVGQLNAASGGVAGSFGYTFASNAVVAGSIIAAGSDQLTATFTPTDSTNYTSGGTTQQTFTVGKYSPRISWSNPSSIAYGTALSGTQLNANANTASYSGGSLAGSFVYNPLSGVVLGVGSQTLQTTFTATDTTNYSANTTSVSLTVNQAVPVITWGTPAAITYPTALSGTQLNASCPQTGGFVYNKTSGTVLPAGTTVIGTTFTPTGADATNYTTATAQVSQLVNKLTPTLSWSQPAEITYGTALSGTQNCATCATTTGTFIYNPANGTILGAGVPTLGVTFTPTDSTNYTTATGSVSLSIHVASPPYSWSAPAAITYGTPLSSTQLNADFYGLAGTTTYTPASGTILGVGVNNLGIYFNPDDHNNYSALGTQRQITVNQATPSITWNTPSAITYGTALSSMQLCASSATAGSFTYNKTSGTILPAGTTVIGVTLTPTDSTNYTTKTAQVSQVVNKAAPTITWNPSPTNFTLSSVGYTAGQLNATSGGVAGSFAYSNYNGGTIPVVVGTILGAGTKVVNATFTPTDTTNYSVSTMSQTFITAKFSPRTTWNNPANITYGTALSATQLNANSSTASLYGDSTPGTFVYNPLSGTVLSAGTHTLYTTFSPTYSTNYSTNNTSVTLIVNKITPTVTWATPSAINYGTALNGTQLNAGNSLSLAGAYVYTPASGTVLSAGSQTLNVTFNPTDSTNYSSATGSTTLTINKASPVITWSNPSSIAHGTALSGTQLNANSGGVAGSFVYTPVSGNVLGIGDVQTLSCVFTPSGLDAVNYTTQTGNTSINITAITPVANFVSNITTCYPQNIVQFTDLSNISGSNTMSNPSIEYGLPLGTVDSDVVLTQSSAYYRTGAKSMGIISQVPTYSDYPYAAVGRNNIYLQPSTQYYWEVWVYSPVNTGIYPNIMGVMERTGANRALGMGSVNGINTFQTLPAGVWTRINGTFTTPSDVDNGGTNYQNQLVLRPAMTDASTYNMSQTIYYDDIMICPVNWAWDFGDNTTSALKNPTHGYTLAGNYTVSLQVSTTVGNSDTETRIDYINVNQETPVITWNNPDDIVYGTALSTTQLNAAANIPGDYTYTPTLGTILSAGNSQTLHVLFTPTDNILYSTATKDVSVNVSKISPTITWNQPNAITYGTALSGTQLSATSQQSGSFSYNPLSGTVLAAGSQTLNTTFTPSGADATNYTTNTTSVSLTINKATPTVTWDTPAAINYGTALSGTQLNAECATTTGSFTYNPVSGTVLPVGTDSLSVTFTPTDSVNYTNAYANVSIVVHNAIPVASFTKNLTSGNLPLAIAFTDTSTGANITTWDWNFGDGSTHGTTQNVAHVYTVAGTYLVNVTVTNDGGSSTSESQQVVIHNTAPIARFTSNVTNGHEPFAVQFTDQSTGVNITSWLWNFGDSNTSNVQNPIFTYEYAGNFNVTLTVTNDGGSNTTMIEDYMTAYDSPCSILSQTTNSSSETIITGHTLSFSETSVNARTTNWYVNGVLSQSNGMVDSSTFAHTFNTDGAQNVTLVVANNWNAVNYSWHLVAISNGTLVVQSTPTAADIYIDGVSMGTTSGQFSLQPGDYSVLIHYLDHVDSTQVDQVTSSTITYDNRTLVPAPGSISITSIPMSATVYIDNVRQLTTTPCVVDSLTAGTHNVKLVANGYREFFTPFTIVANHTFDFDAVMVPSTNNVTTGNGSISLTSTPDEALVYMNGVLQDSTTPTVIQGIDAGTYNLTVAHDGYASSSRIVTVIPNTELQLNFVLSAPAYAHITTTPSMGAVIYVDVNVVNPETGVKDLGYSIGASPIDNVSIPAGSHEFTAYVEGYYNSSVTAVLPEHTITNVNIPISTQPNTGQFVTTSQPNSVSYIVSGGDFVGGKTYSGTTPNTASMYTGAYTAIFSSPNYNSLVTTTNIYNGQTTTYNARMSPLNGTLCVVVPTPDACRIYVDGIFMGTTTNTVDNALNTPYHIIPTYISLVSNTTHNVRIEKDGYGSSPSGARVYSTAAFVPVNGEVWIVDSLVTSSANGTLYVTTTPEDSEIYIDDVDCGAGPDVIIQDITAGVHTLRVTRDSYVTNTMSFQMPARGNLTANVVLSTAPKGALSVYSSPSGADVVVNGQYLGMTPFTTGIEPGTHTLLISKTGYTQSSEDVSITSGDTTTVSRTLTAIPAILNIDVTPSGAMIYINNQQISQVTPHTINLAAGTYNIKVTLPNYAVFERTVVLNYGDVVTLSDAMLSAVPPITGTSGDVAIITTDSLSTTALYSGSEVDVYVITNTSVQAIVAELAGPCGYEYYVMSQVGGSSSSWALALHPMSIGHYNVTRYFVTVSEGTHTEASVNNIGFNVVAIPPNPSAQPVANFATSSTYGYVQYTAKFTDTSTNLPTSWSWNFGDGETSTSRNPTHTYVNDGVYDVALTATNSAGSNTKTINHCITVEAMPSDTSAKVRVPSGTSSLGAFSPQNSSRVFISNTSGMNISANSDLWNNVKANVSTGYALASLMVLAIAAGAIMRYMGFI